MQIPRLTCKRCGHTWYIRIPDPVICPRCKNRLEKETGDNAAKHDHSTKTSSSAQFN